jgi:hypothetical protein
MILPIQNIQDESPVGASQPDRPIADFAAIAALDRQGRADFEPSEIASR